jgi:uncharacterized protein YndB with AHSA1/START domain
MNANAMNTDVTSPAGEAVIVMTRTFDAPRDVVWRAFTDPKHVSKWYGGFGFSSPVCEMDVRVGGIWRHVMKVPSGAEYPMEFEYVEVVKPEKLVWRPTTHGKKPRPGQMNVTNTVTLEDAGKKTKWKLVALFDSVADRDQAMKNGFSNVITQGCEKLNDIVKELAAS